MNRSCFFLALLAGWGLLLVVSAEVAAQSIVPSGNTGTIVTAGPQQQTLITGGTQAGSNLFHQFQQFGIGAGASANFSVKPSVGNIFSQITGGQASLINGQLQVTGSNANLFLINPAGVIFGQSARLDLPGSFVVTTADAVEFDRSRWLTHSANTNTSNNYAGLTGTVTGYRWLTPTPGAVINAGNLAVAPGQSVMLSGGAVINTGTIEAPEGAVTIAAVPGEKVLRVSQANQVLSLDLPLVSDHELAALPKPPAPARLPELLSGRDIAEATGLTLVDGKVQLAANQAPIAMQSNQSIVSGDITAAAIDVTGERIDLQAANLQASQPQGGGRIRVGGDYQGQGDIPRAKEVRVDAASRLEADATVAGNGGKIIVWSDGHTQFAGEATAKGKGTGGNGGLVETSGKETLDVTSARVNASGSEGKAGEWLLDPTNVDIANGGAGVPVTGTFDPATTGAASVIAPGTIAAALDSGTNVTITTAGGTGGQGDITLSNSINQTGGGNATLTLTGRRFNRAGAATINLSSTGDLTYNINQINPEANPQTASIQNAIDAIGTVPGARRINLGAGLYRGAPGGSLINVDRDVTINGAPSVAGLPTSYIDGGGTARPFFIAPGSRVSLSNLGIQNGFTSATESGGGILNSGQLTLQDVAISNNRAGLDGGGIDSSDTTSSLVMVNTSLFNNRAGVDGGGGFFNGNTQLISGSVNGNQAGNHGGGIYNQGNLTMSTFGIANNTALNGGGIYNNGAGATVIGSDFSIDRNTATNSSGGGIFNRDGRIDLLRGGILLNNASTRGGGIFSIGGNVNLGLVGVEDNQAGQFGAGMLLDSTNAVVDTTSFQRNIAVVGGGGINLDGTSQLSLNLSTFLDNRGRFGGGINTNPSNGLITINQSQFDGNRSDFGGAILNETNMTVDRSIFRNNIANFDGGAIDNTGSTARLTIRNSILENNRAIIGQGGAINSSNGGTVDAIASIFRTNQAAVDGGAIRTSQSTLNVDASEFAGNQATFGGAIESSLPGNIQITGSTFRNNIATQYGGAIQNDSSGIINIAGSQFASNRTTLFDGGAIHNRGALRINGSTFLNNQAAYRGGAIGSTSGTLDVRIDNTTFTGNQAVDTGGVIYQNTGIFNTSNSLFDGNQSGTYGGAIFAEAIPTAIIDRTRFRNNTAQIGGGAVFGSAATNLNINQSDFTRNQANTSDGGAILSVGNATIQNSGFTNNRSNNRGGAIFSTDSSGAGNLSLNSISILNNSAISDGGGVFAAGNLQIQGANVSNNTTGNNGGGVYATKTVNITNSIISNNRSAMYGGGLDLLNATNSRIQQTLVQGNQSGDGGGGIALSGTTDLTLDQIDVDSNQARRGGGLDATRARNYSGTLNIFNSTFSNNQATLENGGGIDINPIFNPFNATNIYDSTFNNNRAVEDGGAIAVGGEDRTNLVNVTIANNQANRDAGGILSYGNFRFNHVTIANNQADADGDGVGSGGGALVNGITGPIRIANTIIAKNRVANNQTGNGTDVTGDFTDQGNNLIGIVDGATGFSSSTLVGNSAAPIDPLLSPLGNYGGLTQTLALLPGSRAIDAANGTGTAADQRGIGRVGAAADIGAFESRGFTLSSTGSGQSALINTAFANPLQLNVLSAFGEPVDGGQITFSAPTSGSSITLSPNPQPITITGGNVILTANANAIDGTYNVIASGNALPSTAFSLTNTLPPPPPVPPVVPPVPPVVPAIPPVTVPSPALPSNLPIYPMNSNLDQSSAVVPLPGRLESLDASFSQDYITQFGKNIVAKTATEVDTGRLLTNLDRQRGLRSAVIYAMFVPQEFAPAVTDNDDAKSAAIPTLLRATERRDNDRLELIFITGEGKLYRRSTTYQRREVEATIAHFSLINSDIENPESFNQFGQQLQQWLFEPVRQDLEKFKVNGLMYVLDQGLRSLPIAAMQDDQQTLIERYTMAVIPSLGILDRQQNTLRHHTTLAAGASKFKELSPLPAVPAELAMIQRQDSLGVSLLNEQFTIANLKRQQQAYHPNILHLATHADFNSGAPSNSAIQFFDEALPLSQIDQLGLSNSKLELLILSACNTAIGDPKAELGFTGIASLLGVRTALGSLWSISDVGTYAFMSEFYSHLGKTPSRSETLRLTQLAIQQGKVRIEQGQLITSHGQAPLPPILANQPAQTFNHPYFWSGFTMVGNPW